MTFAFMDWLCNARPQLFMLCVIVVISIPFGLFLTWVGEGKRSMEPHKMMEYIEVLEAKVAALESGVKEWKMKKSSKKKTPKLLTCIRCECAKCRDEAWALVGLLKDHKQRLDALEKCSSVANAIRAASGVL